MSVVTSPPLACNPTLHATFDLLDQGVAMLNPITSLITGCASGAQSKITDCTTLLVTLNLNPILNAHAIANVTDLKTQLIALTGQANGTGFTDSPLGHFQAWTDFSSGKGGIQGYFPFSALQSQYGNIAGYGLLASATFMTALGMAKGDASVQQELCTFNADDPCSSALGLFGSILGTFNANLQAILNFLNSLVDLTLDGLAAQVTGFINDIIARLTAEITALCSMLLRALNYGIAKFFTAIKLDPCLQQVLMAVGTDALKAALEL